MSRLFDYGVSLESKTTEVLSGCEEIVDAAFKASGESFMSVLTGMDAETGALIGGCMKMYNGAKELSLMQAKAIDTLLTDFEELKEQNDKLRKQNEELRSLLQELNRTVNKIGK